MAPQQSAKFRSAFLGQFRTNLRKDSVANYASVWTLFSTSVTERDILCNALTVRRSVCRWRHKIRKIAVEILQSANNRTQSLREILHIVIIDRVINTILGRLTLDPAGMHCPSWDDAIVSSCLLIVCYLFHCCYHMLWRIKDYYYYYYYYAAH